MSVEVTKTIFGLNFILKDLGRIDLGLKSGNYFEVISLADSIITDRLNSLVQHIRQSEDDDFPHQSVGGMVLILMKEIKEREFPLPNEIKTIVNQMNN